MFTLHHDLQYVFRHIYFLLVTSRIIDIQPHIYDKSSNFSAKGT